MRGTVGYFTWDKKITGVGFVRGYWHEIVDYKSPVL